MPHVEEAIVAKARELGFDAVGFARADVELTEDFERYRAFVREGMHGEMTWLAAHGDVRRTLDHEGILPGARSVICVAQNYQRSERDEASDPPLAKLVARYARGRDYHGHMKKRLRKLAAFVRSLGSEEHPVLARPMADDAPVLERAWAARAGLGFIGKNGLLIVPGLGSMVLLGEVVTTLELTASEPMTERCGSCTRCLEACPTDAFVRPFVLDARRCVSYLTIELRSPIEEGFREAVGAHLFGCDDCQTVCPFNTRGQQSGRGAVANGFEPLGRLSGVDLISLLALPGPLWNEALLGSPMKRAKAEGLARNAAIVLGNRRDRAALAALEEAAHEHPSTMVRDAAAWAVQQILAS